MVPADKFPMTLYLPALESEGFINRAKSAFPVEIEDYILGRVEGRHLQIYHIIPTLPEHVEYRDSSSVCLRPSAYTRASELAGERDLVVAGSIHSHPYRSIYPAGTTLSRADHKSFDSFDPPFVIGILKIVPAKKDVGSFQTWFSFWQRHTSLQMRVKHT